MFEPKKPLHMKHVPYEIIFFSFALSLSPAQCEVWMLISESSWRLFNWSNLLCWTVEVLWEYLGWRATFLSLTYSPSILFHATIFIALTRFRAGRAAGLQVHRGKWMASSPLEPPVEREGCCPKEQWQLWKVKEAWGDTGGSQWKGNEWHIWQTWPSLLQTQYALSSFSQLLRLNSRMRIFFPQKNYFFGVISFLFTVLSISSFLTVSRSF